jgi:hypothetical protein
MLCPTCHGHHWLSTPNGSEPCTECGGMGEIHCCEGLCVPTYDADSVVNLEDVGTAAVPSEGSR